MENQPSKYEIQKHQIKKTLTFLDIQNKNKLDFKVLHKLTKNDLINFYSQHSQKIKSELIIDFSVLRICSMELPKKKIH